MGNQGFRLMAAVVVGLLCSCGSEASSAPAATPTPTPTVAEPSPPAAPVTGLDLHSVDWRETTMPGRACFQRRPIRLHHGKGAVYERPGFLRTAASEPLAWSW